MKPDEKSVIKWGSTRNLYCDWGSFKVCLKVFTLIPVGAFVFFTVVAGFIDGFSLKHLVLWGKIWGVALLIVLSLLFPSYYLWAWANGGVDEWECELDRHGIKGRKIAHNQGRLKFLRSIAWIMMLFPMKPGQRMALHNFLYDKGQKEKYFDLSMLRDSICDERRGKVAIDTVNGVESIYMPREVYAEVVEFIEELRQKKRAKRKPAVGRKRKSKTVSETTPDKKEP